MPIEKRQEIKERKIIKIQSEEEVNKETEELWADEYKVLKCSVFGPSYEDMGPGLCIQKCPYGWKDLGRLCKKPFTNKNHKTYVMETLTEN